MEAQYIMELSWKEFNLDVDSVKAEIASMAGENFCGCAADYTLQLFFLEEPTQEVKDLISTYWNSIDSESPEAEAYVSISEYETAIAAARESAVTKDWDQMSTAERKVIVGLQPTKAELGL